MKKQQLKIDLVYTWVNGNDVKWQKEKEKWAKKENADYAVNNVCRFFDNEELRYSLRSIEKNAPWINKIYIITNGQVPEWLDTSHPKIKIITHDQIMPKDALPTFNSDAIETCIANIPELSEYFLYANDDFFLNQYVEPDYFFDEHNNPILRVTPKKWAKNTITNSYCMNLQHVIKIIKDKYGIKCMYEPIHNIEAYRKSYCQACLREFADEVKKTLYSRFRGSPYFQRFMYTLYMISHKIGRAIECPIHYKGNPISVLYLGLHNKINMQNVLNKANPVLFCVNDSERTQNDHRLFLQDFLVSLFPSKSSFEKTQSLQILPIAKHKDACTIVFAPDNKYCKYFSVALQSLIEHARKDKFYDLLVFHNDITLRNQELLQKMLPDNFSLRFIDIDIYYYEIFGALNLQAKNNWSISMYYRIFIPLIMRQYERVLYCDSDICFNHDISDLFDYDFEEKQIMAVKDHIDAVLYLKVERLRYMEKILCLQKPDEYFNSGLLMFNIKNIEESDYRQRVLQAFSIAELQYPDQDILNVIFENRVKYLSSQWNYLYGDCAYNPSFENIVPPKYKEDFIKGKNHPYIIHFTSPRKPWSYPWAEYAEVFWKHALKSPYFAEILMDNIGCRNNIENMWKVEKKKTSILGIPFFKSRKDPRSYRLYLFKIIPLLKITYREKYVTYKLFNVIPLVRKKILY